MENTNNNLWVIKEDSFHVENNRHYEGLFTTGNGYMSVRGSLEEGLEDDYQGEEYNRLPANVTLEAARNNKSKWGTYIPGVMGPHPVLNDEIINIPWFLGITLWFDWEKLDMENCSISAYERSLNLEKAILKRSFIWNTRNGAILEVCFERFISASEKNLSVQSVSVTVKSGNGVLCIEAGLDANVRTNGYNHFKSVKTSLSNDYIHLGVVTNGNNILGEACAVKSAEIKNWHTKSTDQKIAYSAEKNVCAGDSIAVLKLVSIATDRDLSYLQKDTPAINYNDIKHRCEDILRKSAFKTFDQLFFEHNEIWMKKWETSDVAIEGDEEAQLAIRFSIYHLIRCNAEEDPRVSICAKGYAGDAYFGRSFWDSEIFMLPFFLYTNPKAAKNLLKFRYNSLEGAKQNARNYGYPGARFPWESSLSGLEQCALWQYGDHEVHITADIAYALWNYYTTTGDFDFIAQYGMDILVETSRYWSKRVDRNPSTEGYDLLGVMGPDEYLPLTRNSAFTNRMVKHNLSKALEALDFLKKKDIKAYEEKVKALEIKEEELSLFKEISEKLPLPYDKEKELVLQCEEFYQYVDLDFDEIWKDRSRPFGHFISQEKMYRSKCLKQADVLELMRLFPHEFTDSQVKAAYEYYEPITTHDSSLSAATHAIIACRLGKLEEAGKFLRKILEVDLSLKKKGAAEGIHIANCGGLWQLIVFGFAGLDLSTGAPEANPKLPKNWTRLCFSVIHKDQLYKVEITPNSYSIQKQ